MAQPHASSHRHLVHRCRRVLDEAVELSKEAFVSFSSKTPTERGLARGSHCKLLGPRIPETVPALENHLRAELDGVLTSVTQTTLPCEIMFAPTM